MPFANQRLRRQGGPFLTLLRRRAFLKYERGRILLRVPRFGCHIARDRRLVVRRGLVKSKQKRLFSQSAYPFQAFLLLSERLEQHLRPVSIRPI